MGKYSVWSGRFQSPNDEIMQKLNASTDFDHRLIEQDIQGSKAHARMLGRQGIIKPDEAEVIVDGLETILNEVNDGRFEPRTELEDVHMNVEARLAELIGPIAGKLHTARSRNDQVVTDFRLWLRDAIDRLKMLIHQLQRSLLHQSEQNISTIMPGFTHLQCAQPITFAHHLLAYVGMLQRDRERLDDARKRLNESPLGSAALAGTSFPVDSEYTATVLGFDQPVRNSLDAVSSRDFALEFVAAAAICSTHLSRLADEIVLWTSAQFDFVRLSDRYTTGSSIMPQKRNPDAAELIRAKTGRMNGSLMTLLTVLKGLPLAYSKDLQEDKEPVFDAVDTLTMALEVMNGMINDMKPNPVAMTKAASVGFSTATDLADTLVKKYDLPFREAHEIVGKLVLLAEQNSCQLSELTLEQFHSVFAKITEQEIAALSVEGSVASRTSWGGTAPESVRQQLDYWTETLK